MYKCIYERASTCLQNTCTCHALMPNLNRNVTKKWIFHIKSFHSLKRRCVNVKFTLKCWCDANQTECWITNGTTEWVNDEWMNWGSVEKCGSFFRLSTFYIFSATTAAFLLLYEIAAFIGYMVCGSFKKLSLTCVWNLGHPSSESSSILLRLW